MVHDKIWEAAGMPPAQAKPYGYMDGDFLCIGCIEDRLGRLLGPQDFTSAPINDLNPWDTHRLTCRKVGVASDFLRSTSSSPKAPKRDPRADPINIFHNELMTFLVDFSARFSAWHSANEVDSHGKKELMQALYLCSDGLSRLAQEFDGR